MKAQAIDADLGPFGDRIQREASEEFWRYVGRSARLGPGTPLDHASRIAGLSKQHLARLATLHWLLSEEVLAFVEAVPSALARLSRTTAPVESEGQEVRGAINWGATIALRTRTGGMSVPSFVYAEAQARNDTPANRVLKTVLSWIVNTAPSYSMHPDRWADVPQESGRWVAEALRRSVLAQRALRHSGLASVRAPARLSEHEVRTCAAEPSRAYRRAADAARLWRALVEREEPGAVHAMLRRRVLVPAQQFRLFEIWILARIARFFRGRGCAETHVPLLADMTAGPVYRFKKEGVTIDVFFQGLPIAMKSASVYKDLFGAYDLDVGARTPDIVVQRGSRPDSLRLIVEAKASDDPHYVADGVYKTLGYTADFAAALPAPDSGRPAALVVIKTKPSLLPGKTRDGHRVWIATIESLDATLATVLNDFAVVQPE